MSDLLKRIANYFANEYDGDDKTAPKMELSVDELRYIASMNVDRCRAEAELRKLKNKRCLHTNADRIHSMNIEELAEFLKNVKADYQWANPDYPSEDDSGAWVEWLQSEVEE